MAVIDILIYKESRFYLFLLRSTFTNRKKKLPILMKAIKAKMKTKDFSFVPKPIMIVKRESETKAQIRDPPLRRPVI